MRGAGLQRGRRKSAFNATVLIFIFEFYYSTFSTMYLRKGELRRGGLGDWGVIDLMKLQGTPTQVRNHTCNNKILNKTNLNLYNSYQFPATNPCEKELPALVKGGVLATNSILQPTGK